MGSDPRIDSLEEKIHSRVQSTLKNSIVFTSHPKKLLRSLKFHSLLLPALFLSSTVLTILVLHATTPFGFSAGDRRVERAERLQSSAAAARMHTAAMEAPMSSAIPDVSSTSSSSTEESSAASVSASVLDSSSEGSVFLERADNKIGIYLSANNMRREEFLQETITTLLASNGSTVIFDVKGSGVFFHSAAPLANELELVRGYYDLSEIIRRLHEKDIYVIGRFVAIKDDAFTTAMPETKIRHPVTKQVLSDTWIDPANDTAIRFNMEVLCELAEAGIDEVNMDYIRFSTLNFGALKAYSGTEKADRVEKFLRASRETINRCGPKTKLGISTYAILGWAYDINMETLGQDVRRFAPLVDVISPMAYPATFAEGYYYTPGKHPRSRMYYLVHRTLTGYAEFLGPEHAKKIRPWIQGYSVTTKNVTDQIDAVYDAGYCGFTVWNANNNYKPVYAAMKSDTTRPDRCKDDPISAMNW